MQSLNGWVKRHGEAMAEIRRLRHQLDLLTVAFGKLVTLLDDRQLQVLEEELALLEEQFPSTPQ